MDMTQSVQIMKALADQSRLLLLQSLHQPQYVEELARRCALAPSTVCFHLGKLEKAGLVRKKKEQYYVVYALNDEIFDRTLRDLTSFANAEEQVQEERVQKHRAKILKTFMKNGRVTRIPAQYKKRLIVFEEILRLFRPETTYTEREVDRIISERCDDHCTVRRTFVDEHMMVREGNMYRVVKRLESPLTAAEIHDPIRKQPVKTRQEIKREYKERKKPAGIFQIKNTANGKMLLGSSLNLEGPLNSAKFMLGIGSHKNEALQRDWNVFGADTFVFEILEVVNVKDDPDFCLEDELTLMEQIWIERLQPFGERGYNPGGKIRQA
jgi:hypothetical protein